MKRKNHLILIANPIEAHVEKKVAPVKEEKRAAVVRKVAPVKKVVMEEMV